MHFPRNSLPTSKLISKISGNIGPPDVSFSLYWLSRHPPGYLPLFLLFPSHVGIYVHSRLVVHISLSISCTSSKLLCKYTQLFIYTGDCIKEILQWDVDKEGPSKVPAVPDPYLLGSCIAGVYLELLDVLASGILISAKRGKTEKGLIYTIETKASNSWKNGTGRECCPSRDERDRAEWFGNQERQQSS